MGIIFEVQRKMSNEKITRRKKKNSMFFLFFILFGLLLLSNLITFLFILNDLKCYKSSTWSFTNHFGTSIITKQHTRNFLSVWELAFVAFNGLFFWVFDLLCFGRWYLFKFFSFVTIFKQNLNSSYLDTINKGALPLDPACLECLNVRSTIGLPYISKLFYSRNAYLYFAMHVVMVDLLKLQWLA